MKITIGHLYPDLLNLYGDRGNIQCMMKRCQWRGIEAETLEFKLEDEVDFSKLDIVLLGGGSDREQMLVCEKLKEIQKWTSVGVKAAEMIYTESGMGDAKKKYVRKFLESKGYKLDIETVDALIEATVRDMQQEAFEVSALPGADDEGEEEKED